MHTIGIFVGRQLSLVFATLPKATFLYLAIALLVIAVAVKHIIDEPLRGSQEGTLEGFTHPASRRHQLKSVMSRTNFLLIQLSFPGNIPGAVFASFASLFFKSKDYGLGMPAVDVSFAEIVVSLGLAMGCLTGGVIGSILYNRDPKYAVLFSAITCTLRAIPAYFIITWKSVDGYDASDWFVFNVFSLGVAMSLHTAVTNALLLNVNIPESRGVMTALSVVMADISRVVGPASFYILCMVFKDWALCFHMTLILWIVSGMLLVPVCDSLHIDEVEVVRILDDVALDASIKNQKRIAEEEIALRVNEAADAFKHSKFN